MVSGLLQTFQYLPLCTDEERRELSISTDIYGYTFDLRLYFTSRAVLRYSHRVSFMEYSDSIVPSDEIESNIIERMCRAMQEEIDKE